MPASGIGTPDIPALFVLAMANNQNGRIPAFAVPSAQAETSWAATLAYARETGRHPVLWAGSPSQAAAWLGSRPYWARPAAHAQAIDNAAELLIRWARERPPPGGATGVGPLLQVPMPDELTLLLPAAPCWEVPAAIGWGGDGSMPDPEEHMALFQRWHEQFLAEPYLLGPSWAQFVVRRPPLTMDEAREVAWMHYLYAPQCLNRFTPTLDSLASHLCGNARWSFAWDLNVLPGERAPASVTGHDQLAVSLTRHVAGGTGTSAVYGSALAVPHGGTAPWQVDRAWDDGTTEADDSGRRNGSSTSGTPRPAQQTRTARHPRPAPADDRGGGLRVTGLRKVYGDRVVLDGIDLAVGHGQMMGFVGSNGAGKTTTMRIILGVLEPDGGRLTFDDQPLDAARRRRIGYMPADRGLYPKMKIGEQLEYLCRLHGVPDRRARRNVGTWLDRLGIADRMGDPVSALSTGNQQKVQLAAALTHDPELLVLDEPFSGLDPVAVKVMSDVLLERASAGVPVVFSSHQLELVEQLCDEVTIIAGGRVEASGTVDQLRSGVPIRVEIASRCLHRGWTSSLPYVTELGVNETGSAVEFSEEPMQGLGSVEERLAALLAAALTFGPVTEFTRVRPSLTELFTEVVAP